MFPIKARIFYKTPLSNHRCRAICYFLKCLEHLNIQRMLGVGVEQVCFNPHRQISSSPDQPANDQCDLLGNFNCLLGI